MTMNSGSASNTIDSYRKRQQRGPVIIWAIVALLVVTGIIILVVVFTGDNKPQLSLFATDTPTPTLTFTPTVTASPTLTLTPTATFTITPTSTPSAPFAYLVQDGEFLYSIVETFNLGDDGIALLYLLNPAIEAADGVVYPGQEILIPNPGMQLPTATPVPLDLPRGTELEYRIQPGDTIAAIAVKFRSTEDEIIKVNEIEDVNAIQVGQMLIVPANIVTPEPTRLPPTAPASANVTPAATTSASTGGAVIPTPACAYEKNQAYVAQIFELVNEARVGKGLNPVTENPLLSAAAMGHAGDMACNSFLKEVGSNGSTLAQRIAAQKYKAAMSLQEIHAQPPEYGGDGAAAVKAWLGGTVLMNPTATEIGIGYAFFRESALGGYFNVILAAPAQ